jgi:DNA-binding response OmpR family regulator
LFLRRTVLERAGYRVFTALNAEEALHIFGSRKISLVISDHLLPGVTGTEMARTMKLAQPRLPILLLSGVADAPAGTEILTSSSVNPKVRKSCWQLSPNY